MLQLLCAIRNGYRNRLCKETRNARDRMHADYWHNGHSKTEWKQMRQLPIERRSQNVHEHTRAFYACDACAANFEGLEHAHARSCARLFATENPTTSTTRPSQHHYTTTITIRQRLRACGIFRSRFWRVFIAARTNTQTAAVSGVWPEWNGNNDDSGWDYCGSQITSNATRVSLVNHRNHVRGFFLQFKSSYFYDLLII